MALALSVLFAQPASAQVSRVYFAGYLGTTSFNDLPFTDTQASLAGDFEMDNANSFAGALGIRLSRQFRLEGELSYRTGDLSDVELRDGSTFDMSGEWSTYAGLLNIYYDFDVPWQVTPYIGAGIGYGWHEGEMSSAAANITNVSDDAGGLLWQVGGGLKYRVNSELAFSGSYRYLNSTDLEFSSTEVEYNGHEIRIGMEYDLPIATAY